MATPSPRMRCSPTQPLMRLRSDAAKSMTGLLREGCCLGLVALHHPHAACVSKTIVELGAGSRLRPLQAEAPPFMDAGPAGEVP
ncbi:hypothetical protein HaLaN_29353, partial [Haematococcus lacustris]